MSFSISSKNVKIISATILGVTAILSISILCFFLLRQPGEKVEGQTVKEFQNSFGKEVDSSKGLTTQQRTTDRISDSTRSLLHLNFTTRMPTQFASSTEGTLNQEKFECRLCLPRFHTPDEHLRFLQFYMTKGSSYRNEETLEEVPRDTQANVALAIEIKNFLDVPLKNYRSSITKGEVYRKAPMTIQNLTAEVFSVASARNFPEGTFSYQIDTIQISLQVDFLSKKSSRKLAIAFLENTEPITKIYGATNGAPITSDPSATTGSSTEKRAIKLDIHKGNFHARATSRVISTDKHVLSIDVFSFDL